MTTDHLPPALAALAGHPQLQAQHAPALASQARRVAERAARYVARPALEQALDAALAGGGGRLIALEARPGDGATAQICQLAAARPYALWLPQDDAGGGLAALCAQVIALAGLQPALVPPAAGRDTSTLERLLAEAGASRPDHDPLVLLIGRPPDPHAVALVPEFPATIPAGVVLVAATAPGQPLPLAPHALVRLAEHPPTDEQLVAAGRLLRLPPAEAGAAASRAGGSFLALRLAAALRGRGPLPSGLAELHARWWEALRPAGQRIMTLLAAAGAPIELALLAELAGGSPAALQSWLQRWRLVCELEGARVRLHHPATLAFVRERSGDQLASAHRAYAELASARAGGQLDRLNGLGDGYLAGEIARHLALAPAGSQLAAREALVSRSWPIARERVSGTLLAGAGDLAWALRATARDGELLQLLRHALLAGTLAHLGRMLAPDAPAEAFAAAVNLGGAREPTLRRVRESLAQVPDGRDKAQALRRLGEVCYTLRMRASAMRILSEAIDLEAPGVPRQWRDEREETLVTLARAAVAIDMPQTALGITARISHPERRGMIETEAVRWLLARAQLTRAEEVAYAIGHTAMHEWAMAEVAVGHARAGHAARGETVLGTLKTATAVAWARTELACDAARQGDQHAIGRLAPIASPSLVDRALALVALALAEAGLHEAALEAAGTAEDQAIRARALIDLALLHPASRGALSAAAAELAELKGEERAPLVAELAAAQAVVGRLEQALRTTELLAEEEERDRAQSRVAVALARAGRADDARIVAEAIGDNDERDWAFDELARLAEARGEWDEALALAGQIVAGEQRARTAADLAISWARAGHAAEAHAEAARIEHAGERLRALAALADPLVAQGGAALAYAQATRLASPDQRSRYQAAVAAALAAHADPHEAHALAHTIARPVERARALVAIARATTLTHQSLARRALGEALQLCARHGRAETLRCIEWAADTLAHLGGAELLLAAASAIDEIDGWWHR